jgi:hypothetical protein
VPKQLARDFNERLEAAIREHPEGIAAAELAERFRNEASSRTLGRRLKHLLRRERVVLKGAGRASRYYPAPIKGAASIVEATDTLQAVAEIYVPLTAEGTQVRDLIRRPIAERLPVGYERSFLEAYQPNETFYLPTAMRDRLHELGRTPSADKRAGTYARDIMSRLLIDLSWASSRLEGNTYTRLDTQRLIEFGQVAAGKDARETQMILNHKQAIEFLVENAEEIGFNVYTFFNLHALLSENLLADPTASGRIRTQIVNVSGTTYQPLAVPQLLEELFRLILEKAGAIRDAFEQSFFLLVHIPYLQPFEDVNKRVSRVGANIPFLKANLCPLSFLDVPERAYIDGTLGVYELRRVELLRDVFAWAYERSAQRYRVTVDALPEPDPFRLKYREALRELVGTIVREQLPPDAQTVTGLSSGLVAEADRPRFVEMVLVDMKNLHPGNVARYRIRLAEFNAWKTKNP